MRKRSTAEETLEQKILKAQEKVDKTAAAHEKAVNELQKLIDKREAKQKDEIWNAINNSNKSYQEIIDMLKNEKSDNK